MSVTYPFTVKPDTVSDSLHSLQDYLKNTYHDQKEILTECVHLFKEGLAEAFQHTSNCVQSIILPINNFIKDITQIDEEFRQEHLRNEQYCICLEGKMIPRTDVLAMKMEENY